MRIYLKDEGLEFGFTFITDKTPLQVWKRVEELIYKIKEDNND